MATSIWDLETFPQVQSGEETRVTMPEPWASALSPDCCGCPHPPPSRGGGTDSRLWSRLASLCVWSLLTLATASLCPRGRLAANVPDCPPAQLSVWAAATGNRFKEREQADMDGISPGAWHCPSVTRRRSPGDSAVDSGCCSSRCKCRPVCAEGGRPLDGV